MKNIRKTITYDHLIAMKPCYTPESIGINKGFEMSITDFINEYRDKVESKDDIIWCLCRKQYMSAKDMRLFAAWCARLALKLVENPDPRSINACDVAAYAAYAVTKAAAAALSAAAANAANAAADDYANVANDAACGATAVAYDAARDAANDAQIEQLKTYFN